MASFVETHCAATALFVTPLCTACVRGSGRKRRHTCSICLPSTLVGDAQRRALVSYGRSLAPHALGGCQPPAASGPPAAIAGSAYCCDLCWMDIRSRVSQRKPVATRVCGNCADSGESGRTSCGHISPRRVPLWCCFLSPPCLVDGALPWSAAVVGPFGTAGPIHSRRRGAYYSCLPVVAGGVVGPFGTAGPIHSRRRGAYSSCLPVVAGDASVALAPAPRATALRRRFVVRA